MVQRQCDHTRPIVVVSDASDYAIGGVLMQYYEELPCVVALIVLRVATRRRLTPTQMNYSEQEKAKEYLVIKYCLDKFKHYVLTTNITMETMSIKSPISLVLDQYG